MKPKYLIIVNNYCNFIMFMYGISIVMIGTLIPDFILTFNIPLSKVGLIFTTLCIGGIFSLFFGSFYSDIINKSKAIPISFGILGIGYLFIGITETFIIALFIFFFCGFFIRILDIFLNAFIGELYQKEYGIYLNRLHMYFSFGACFGPLYARLLLDLRFTWKEVYTITGLIFLIIAILGFIFISSKKYRSKDHSKHISSKIPFFNLFKISQLWLMGLILLFYSFHQLSVTTWLPYFMEYSLNSTKLLSSLTLSFFWFGIIIGRYLTSNLIKSKCPVRLLLWGAIIGGVVILLGIFSNNLIIIIFAFVFAGITTGSIIPLVITICYGNFPNNKGSTTSFLSIFLIMGQMIGPWFLGMTAEITNIEKAIFLTAITLFGCTIVVFLKSSEDLYDN